MAWGEDTTHCKAGHDLRLPGAIYRNPTTGVSRCAVCKRMQNKRHYGKDHQKRVRAFRGPGFNQCETDARHIETELILRMWERLEMAPPYERASIREEIAAAQRAAGFARPTSFPNMTTTQRASP